MVMVVNVYHLQWPWWSAFIIYNAHGGQHLSYYNAHGGQYLSFIMAMMVSIYHL